MTRTWVFPRESTLWPPEQQGVVGGGDDAHAFLQSFNTLHSDLIFPTFACSSYYSILVHMYNSTKYHNNSIWITKPIPIDEFFFRNLLRFIIFRLWFVPAYAPNPNGTSPLRYHTALTCFVGCLPAQQPGSRTSKNSILIIVWEKKHQLWVISSFLDHYTSSTGRVLIYTPFNRPMLHHKSWKKAVA